MILEVRCAFDPAAVNVASRAKQASAVPAKALCLSVQQHSPDCARSDWAPCWRAESLHWTPCCCTPSAFSKQPAHLECSPSLKGAWVLAGGGLLVSDCRHAGDSPINSGQRSRGADSMFTEAPHTVWPYCSTTVRPAVERHTAFHGLNVCCDLCRGGCLHQHLSFVSGAVQPACSMLTSSSDDWQPRGSAMALT